MEQFKKLENFVHNSKIWIKIRFLFMYPTLKLIYIVHMELVSAKSE
jgi:hypothetical protein